MRNYCTPEDFDATTIDNCFESSCFHSCCCSDNFESVSSGCSADSELVRLTGAA